MTFNEFLSELGEFRLISLIYAIIAAEGGVGNFKLDFACDMWYTIMGDLVRRAQGRVQK